MVDNQVHVPLGKKCKAGALGQYHPKHGVDVFHAAFLSAAHRIAEIDIRPFHVVDAGLQGVRVVKLRTPVGQKDAEKTQEIMCAKFLLQPVKNHADSPFGAAVHQKRQKEFFPFKEEGQEDFF